MKGHGSKFSRKKEEAIAALLSQRTVPEAARVADVGTNTLYRWLRDPEFDRAYRQAQRAAFSQAIARLKQAASAAVSTLFKIMADPAAATPSKVRAAGVVLAHAWRSIEFEDVEYRLNALEQAAADRAADRAAEQAADRRVAKPNNVFKTSRVIKKPGEN